MSEENPIIATNRDGEQVAQSLNDIFQSLPGEDYAISIASAYFNPVGFSLIADALEQRAGKVRILLGAEPQPEPPPRRSLQQSASPKKLADQILKDRLKVHEEGLRLERDQLGFSKEASETAHRLISFVGQENVEVKRLTTEFLHGKTFFVDGKWGAAMVGSSNFTFAGLAKNKELNLFSYDPPERSAVKNWFDELWEDADEFDLADFYQERFNPYDPFTIYVRMLWEMYADELREFDEATESFLQLPEFSRDAVWRARHHLNRRNGVLLADDVGLGKTYQAGELIAEAVRSRERVLVIAPAVLRDGTWRKFLDDRFLSVEVVSFEQLASDERLNPDKGKKNILKYAPNDYSMVVIDEAHNLRNPSTQRAEALRMLLSGMPAKDVVLVTATPVNNSLWDLYNLLKFFIRSDSEFADVGVFDMRAKFEAAMGKNPEDLSADDLSDVLDQVSVRRTRPFIKRYYPNATINVDGQEIVVKFPTPNVKRVEYDFSNVMPGFINDLGDALDGYEFIWGQAPPEGVLAMARYAPSMYRKERAAVEPSEINNAGLLRSLLLKRFESSPVAFASTCRRMATSHNGLIELIQEQGKVAIGKALSDWVITDGDDEEIDIWLETWEEEFDDATDYDTENLCEDLANDQLILSSFADEAEQLQPEDDPKLKALVDHLADIVAEAEQEHVGDKDLRDKRKVLLFTYYTDTVDWIADHLKNVSDPASSIHDPRLVAYHDRVTTISGREDKSEVLFGFAPDTTDAPDHRKDDLYDIVVSTDVLAEGVNLQQARHVINYDLPWNPQRLTQRHGRIDRLLSPHNEVFIRCFFPKAKGDLDNLLNLEARLRLKMNQAIKTFGGTDVLTGEQFDIAYAYTKEQIAKILEENPELFGDVEAAALGGEEYRQQLAQVRQNKQAMQDIQSIPWGSGSGFVRAGGTESGFVFCARVADHDKPFFRFIKVDPATFLPHEQNSEEEGRTIVDNPLACLAYARPFPDGIERNIPKNVEEKIYPAWELARKDITEQWLFATDAANLAPNVPRSLRNAEALIRKNPNNDLTPDQIQDLSGKLLQSYQPRIRNAFSKALKLESETDQVREIQRLVEYYSLQPPPEIKGNPQITEDDVNLVTWMVITN